MSVPEGMPLWERVMHPLADALEIRLWLPPQQTEPSVYRSRAQLQGLLRLRSDISLLARLNVDHASEKVVSGTATFAG